MITLGLQEIKDNLPITRSLIMSASPICNITYSEVLGTGMWTSMLGHYCACHITNIKNALTPYVSGSFLLQSPMEKRKSVFKPPPTFNLDEENIFIPVLKI